MTTTTTSSRPRSSSSIKFSAVLLPPPHGEFKPTVSVSNRASTATLATATATACRPVKSCVAGLSSKKRRLRHSPCPCEARIPSTQMAEMPSVCQLPVEYVISAWTLHGFSHPRRHVGEPGVLPLERDRDRVGRDRFTVLRHDQIGLTGHGVSPSRTRPRRWQGESTTMSASCSIEPDSRRSERAASCRRAARQTVQLRDRAMTGTCSSLAINFSARENSLTSC